MVENSVVKKTWAAVLIPITIPLALSCGGILDRLTHLVLPLATLPLHQLALMTGLTWTGVERELSLHYVQAAEGRGLKPRDVLLSHALRNALPPLATIIGARMGAIFSGAG